MKQWIVRAMPVVFGIWLGAVLLPGDWRAGMQRQATEVTAGARFAVCGVSGHLARHSARRLSLIEAVAPHTQMIYLPLVNVVVFETEDGLVLVDAGMPAAGPVVRELIASVTDARERSLRRTL